MDAKDFTGSTRQGSERDASVEPRNVDDGNTKVDQDALQAGIAFYDMFTSACHGISRRQELDQLYQATYLSFGSKHEQRPEFSKVLFAMAREMKVLKVIRGGTISWRALSQRDDRRPRYDDRQDRDDRRPRFDDRQDRDDRRPRFDDRRPHEDRRPRFDDRRPHEDRHDRDDRRDDRRPRFDERRPYEDRRNNHHSERDGPSAYYGNQRHEHHAGGGERGVSVERQ